MAPIRVLVVDDSAVMCAILSEVLGNQPDIEVIGTARDPFEAREKIKALEPQVITLDIEMPRMDGLTFLEKLMRLRPMPVIMVSSLTRENAMVTLRALELGAFDFVRKPGKGDDLAEFGQGIVDRIRAAAAAKIRYNQPPASLGNTGNLGAPLRADYRPARSEPAQSGVDGPVQRAAGAVRVPAASALKRLIVIGASTGGTDAVREVLTRMPEWAPPILVVQHMPEMFTAMFAKRLDSLCRIRVKEAENGEKIIPGTAYIAPGNWHMEIARAMPGAVIRLNQKPPVNRHRPAVDVTFRSVAACAGPEAIALILTGMGADGAAGMRELKGAGAVTFAQDEASCVVFGMPKVAIETGCIDEVVAIEGMTARILAELERES